ncbi:aldose epimerase family protein [Staphylococcus equorum]|uniref:aldose epimerase family protein n=1 Tax=Staphylococcus equorum TaxID=246432 RepID=UPI0025562CD6|nr:aldose epimerase family protein [Staphylococcus equorum]MDK9858273.1 galactose mutarotase [Staphylococcus equorum]MDK9875210.1 galactose mutarotase [Staphylococcus equorum]
MFAKVESQSNGIDLIKIDNEETKIVFTNYGARIVSWKYDDNNIVLGNVVEADEFYEENPFHFGATIGRYGGRIANATFELDGKTYHLDANNGEHNIHGGPEGIGTRFFDYEIEEQVGQVKVIFTTTIKSSDDHFPGDIDLEVIHTYDVDHKWTIEYKATATEKTLFNPMNHVYFNLNRDNNVIDNHSISSSKLDMYLLGDDNIVESMKPIDLVDTFNEKNIQFKDIFTSEHPVVKAQMERFGGIDHPIDIGGNEMTVENKRFLLTVNTDMPNVVIFTFNDTTSWQSDFNIYKAHSGFTLETQCIPNDINLMGEKAPSILEANQPYYSKTSYKIFEKEL